MYLLTYLLTIIMAAVGMAHEGNGHIFTSSLQSDVIIVFIDPDFSQDP